MINLILTFAVAHPQHPIMVAESDIKTSTELFLSLPDSTLDPSEATSSSTESTLTSTTSTLAPEKVAADLFRASFRPRRPATNPLLYYHILSGF